MMRFMRRRRVVARGCGFRVGGEGRKGGVV